MNIKAIIFDFGQVLNAPIDADATEVHRAKMARRLGLSADELWPYLFGGELANKWMTGSIAATEFWTQILAPLGVTDPEAVADFAATIFTGSEEFHPEMIDLLHELKGRYKLAVLSNADWSEEQMLSDFTESYGLPDDLFDVIVTSASVGVAKPDPAIFHYTLDRLGVSPDEAIFTDDLATFTEAAAAVGLHTFTFTTPAEFRQYLEQLGVL